MRACYCREDRCECNLKNVGYAVGWLGAICRTLSIGTLAVLMAELSDDEHLHMTLYSILLTYGFMSLATNFLLIVGISKKKPNYLVPYLGIYGVEISAAVIIFIGGVIAVAKMQKTALLFYLIPSGLVFLSVYSLLWWLLLRLFQDFKLTYEENSSIQSVASDFRSVICSCGCFKSDSLDIVT